MPFLSDPIQLDNWTDRFNPMLVREVRQASRSKLFLAPMALLLFAAWVVTLVGLLGNPVATDLEQRGPEFFEMYYVGLVFCVCLPPPFAAFQWMREEFEEAPENLLLTTPLPPVTIINGKLQSGLLLAALYGAALLPFISIAWMMGGLDLLPVLLLLAIVAAACLQLVSLGVMLGTYARSSGWTLMMTLVEVGVSGLVVWMLLELGSEMIGSGRAELCCAGFCFGFMFTTGISICVGVAGGRVGRRSGERSTWRANPVWDYQTIQPNRPPLPPQPPE